MKEKESPFLLYSEKIRKSTLRISIHVPLSEGYFKTPPLPCPAALRGVVYKIEAEAKGEYISPSSSAVPRSIAGRFAQQNIEEVSGGRRG